MHCELNKLTIRNLPEGCESLATLNKSLNFNLEEALQIITDFQKDDRNLHEPADVIFICIYIVLMALGICANLLVCFVVARKSQMHTSRNLYIVNLSISDLTMCVMCMPFTLVMILKRNWKLGSVLCKLVPVLQGTNIMISTGTITIIALDRYFTIVRHHNTVSTRSNVIMCIICVWLFSILTASPLAYYQVVEPITFHNVVLYTACMEKWPSHNLKIFYTACIMLVQSVIPSMVVGNVHLRIASYLNSHAQTQTDERRAQKELKRNKKTTCLLLGIAILFLLSWFPLNTFSLLADILYPPGVTPTVSVEKLYLVLAICHVIAMTSAVTNPIVYGFMNTNIRYEFMQLFSMRCKRINLSQNVNGRGDQTTTKTAMATSTQRKNGHVMPSLKEKSEKPVSPIPAPEHIETTWL